MVIESVIKVFPTKKRPGSDDFLGELYQRFKKMQILLKLFQNIEEEGTLLNSFYEASITLVPKSDKDTAGKETIGQYS